MADYEPYSVRTKRSDNAGKPAIYIYHPISEEMRAQAVTLLRRFMGPYWLRTPIGNEPNQLWDATWPTLLFEHGHLVSPYGGDNPELAMVRYVMSEPRTERVLDVLELLFRYAQQFSLAPTRDTREKQQRDAVGLMVTAAAMELNKKLSFHNLGFELVGNPGLIIRKDSQYVHSEIVEPAIALLHHHKFVGPLDEFMKAHREYRKGDNKDALNDALKAFESTMKAICDARGWKRDPNWSATSLIKALINNGLFPPALESYMTGVRTVLESGVPTLRNKLSGHGQGPEVVDVPDHVAAFALHLTAANIVFLMNSLRELN